MLQPTPEMALFFQSQEEEKKNPEAQRTQNDSLMFTTEGNNAVNGSPTMV